MHKIAAAASHTVLRYREIFRQLQLKRELAMSNGKTRAERRARRSYAVGAVACLFGLALQNSVALADDYAGCVDAFNRYNANIDALNASKIGAGSASCRAIKPEVGYAACEKFIRSGLGTTEQRQWASKVSDNLAGAYQRCQAQ